MRLAIWILSDVLLWLGGYLTGLSQAKERP